MWQAQYGGRSDVLGARLQIGPTLYTVIGVAPRGFVGLRPAERPRAFIPISVFAATQILPPGQTWWTSYTAGTGAMVVQRRPGVSITRASADLTRALARSADAEGGPTMRRLKPRSIIAPILTERGPAQTRLAKVALLVAAMALTVLAVACANVANLQLARALRRRRDTAVRLALGMGRGRLLSQLLIESVLLALIAGVAGLAAAQSSGAALRRAFPPLGAEFAVFADMRTLIVAGVAVLFAAF